MFELVHVMSTHVWVGRLQSVLATVCGFILLLGGLRIFVCVHKVSNIVHRFDTDNLFAVVWTEFCNVCLCWTHWDVLTSSKPSFIFYTTSFLTIPAFWFFYTRSPHSPIFLRWGRVLCCLFCCVVFLCLYFGGGLVCFALSALHSSSADNDTANTWLCAIVVKKQRSP